MIVEAVNEYLETVAGYIFDDDKLVTYKWLSKELEVHVNVAKEVLSKFREKYKEEKNFECTFLLMGILRDGGMRVEIVKEEHLQTAKEKYSKILSQHIYSLQKVLSDIHLLAITENGDIKYSAIKCIENNERSNEEIHKLRWRTESNKVQSVPQEKVKQAVAEAKKLETVVSPEKNQVTKKQNAERNGFNNLFGKTINKQKDVKTEVKAKTETDSSNSTNKTSKDAAKSSKKTTRKGGLTSFLQQGKNETKTVNPSSSNASSIENGNTEEKIVLESNNKQKKIGRGKKRTHSKETSKSAKKLKRITIQSDSSDTESSEEEQEQSPPSPEHVPPVREHSPSPPKHKIENGKRRVLKMVDQTFEEDGYLVTKKVHVYESCSEEEQEIENVKKPTASVSHPETKGKKNTKQTSLMNFFKKS